MIELCGGLGVVEIERIIKHWATRRRGLKIIDVFLGFVVAQHCFVAYLVDVDFDT